MTNNLLTITDGTRFRDGITHINLSYKELLNLEEVRLPVTLKRLDLHHNPLTGLYRVRFPEGLREISLGGGGSLKFLDGVVLPERLGALHLFDSQTINPDYFWLSPKTQVHSYVISDLDTVSLYCSYGSVEERTVHRATRKSTSQFLIRLSPLDLFDIEAWIVQGSYWTEGVVFRRLDEAF